MFHEELGLTDKCDYTEGWLQRFKSRHCLMFHAVCGEKRSADMEAAIAEVDEFAKLVSDENSSAVQVYNAESQSGFKASKDRVTVRCCSNADLLLVTGKSLLV